MCVTLYLLTSNWLESGHVVILSLNGTEIHCVCVCPSTQLKFESLALVKKSGEGLLAVTFLRTKAMLLLGI